MLFVLAGPSYVGKKSAMYHFIKLYSFSSIIPYTTKVRNPESGEVEGIHYHYVRQEDIGEITDNTKYIFDKPFDMGAEYQNDDIYAYKKSDIEKAITSHSNYIIHASVGNAIQIHTEFKNRYRGNLYILFLRYFSDLTEEFFVLKCPFPIESDKFKKRFLHAKKEMRGYDNNLFDEIFPYDKTYEMCEELEKYILPKLEVMPTSPDKIPGPLSDNDLIYTFENRKNDKLIVKKDGIKVNKEQFCKMLCGCGLHITLSNKIRKIKEISNNYIDMSDEIGNIENKLSKLFERKSIDNGYVLKPNETILCTSNEEIYIPHDIYAIVSSKFSYSQLGLSIELGTSVIQSGHNGKVNFQIKNQTNNYMRIFPGIEVAQLIFFRTILPSSLADQNNNVSHNYNAETSPPLSKFRENNIALDNVVKKNGRFGEILGDFFKNSIVKLMGILVTGIFAFLALKNKITYINDFIFSIIDNMSALTFVFYLSLFMWLLNILFYVVGQMLCKFFKHLRTIAVKLWVYCFGNGS